jgi:hypothetical protein
VSEATPRPWRTDEPYFIYIWGPDQAMVADIPGDEDTYLVRMRGVGRGATEEEQRANAALIVKAVNSHDELLAAAQAALALLAECDAEDTMAARLLRAAIAKARA